MKYLAVFLGDRGHAVKFESDNNSGALMRVLLSTYHNSDETLPRMESRVGKAGIKQDKILRAWHHVERMIDTGYIPPVGSLAAHHVDYVLNLDTGEFLVENDLNTVDMLHKE